MRYEIPPPANKYNVWVQGHVPIRGMLVVGETKAEVQANARMRAMRYARLGTRNEDLGSWKPLHPMFQNRIRANGGARHYHRDYGITERDGVFGVISEHSIYYLYLYEYPTLVPKIGHKDTYIPRRDVRPTSRNQFTAIRGPEKWKWLPAGAIDWQRTRMHSSFMRLDGEWVVLDIVGNSEYALEYEAFIASLDSNHWVGSYEPT